MARPTKKRDFRSIVVDDAKYQWRFDRVLTVFADSDTSRRGQKLIVDWGWVDWHEPEYADAAEFDPHVVTPGFVRLAIQYSVTAGWKPNHAGLDFHVSYATDQFKVATQAT